MRPGSWGRSETRIFCGTPLSSRTKSPCFNPYTIPPLPFSTSVGTRTSVAVTRKVVVSDCALGIGCGGSAGGNCCEAAAGNHIASVQRARRGNSNLMPERTPRGKCRLPADPRLRARTRIIEQRAEVQTKSVDLMRLNSPVLPGVAFEPASPSKKTQKFPARGPDEAHHAFGGESLCALAGVSLNTPAEILASPGSQPMAASCIPDKSERSQHGESFSFKYRRLWGQFVRTKRCGER